MRGIVTWIATNLVGQPDATLTPSLLQFRDRAASARTTPPILNFGNGLFGFIPSDSDVAAGIIYVVDNGPNAELISRYFYGTVHELADPLDALLVLDALTLAPFAGGGAPTVAGYVTDAGAPVAPPPLVTIVAPYLFAMVPATSDMAAGVSYRIDAPGTAVFGDGTVNAVGSFFNQSAVRTDKITWLATDAGGVPDPTATPSLPTYSSRTGTWMTQPSILNLGYGIFSFNPTALDTLTGVAFLVDNGAGRANRYVPGVSCSSTDPIDCVLLVNSATGALWSGTPPAVTTYEDTLLNARLRPNPVPIASPYLYTLLPSVQDIGLGVAASVDGPPGAWPQRQAYSFLSIAPIVAAPPAPVPISSSVFAPLFIVQQDFGIDISTYPDLDASFSLLQGNRVLMENVVRRWTCGQGALLDAPDIGIDVRQYLNDGSIMGNLGKTVLSRMKTAMENEAKRDSRVANCVVDLQWNQATQAVTARAELDAAGGPFKLELVVTAVTVSLLSLG